LQGAIEYKIEMLDFVSLYLKYLFEFIKNASFYLLLGFLLAGIIHEFVSTRSLAKHLGKRDFKSILKASLIGAPLPLCSCGVIPTALALRKEGASKEATVAFLISTPETGVDSITISYALLDPLMTVYRPIAGMVKKSVVVRMNAKPSQKVRHRKISLKNLKVLSGTDSSLFSRILSGTLFWDF